jgi:hypothetical protein
MPSPETKALIDKIGGLVEEAARLALPNPRVERAIRRLEDIAGIRRPIDGETLDKALDSLSHARTALDDPGGLSVRAMSEASQFGSRLDGHIVDEQALKAYAIDKIDDAMRLLGSDEEER